MSTQERGRSGEQIAAAEYEKEGYTVEARNFRTRFGEVDLILRKGGLYVFSEVKTRAMTTVIPPAAAVTPMKQQKIILAAQGYLAHKRLSDPNARFDVVEVFIGPGGSTKVNIIENAFTL